MNPQTTYLLGVDPGLTTGWALAHRDGDGWSVRRRGAAKFEEACADLDRFVSRMGHDVTVVAERAALTAFSVRTPHVVWAFEMTGALRSATARYGATLVVAYDPATAKSLARDGLLRELYLHSTSAHVRDATRQIVVHLLSSGWQPRHICGIV